MTEIERLLADMIALESVNPCLRMGSMSEQASGERDVARYVEKWLRENGLEVHWLEATPGRPSIVGIAKGSGGGRSLMFNGHMDTVGLFPFDGDPLIARIEQGRMYGRGAFDMKSGVAAMMVAARNAKRLGLRGDILVACVADEEYASVGTEEVVSRFQADAAIVTEPTQMELTIAHKGFVWFELTVHGTSAHGSRPDLGLDAITKMGKFLMALEQYGTDLNLGFNHPLLRSGSVHASLIAGGQELSSYPAECKLSLERRTLPGETAESVERELLALLQGIADQDRNFRYTLVRGLGRPPMEVSRDEPIVEAVQIAMKTITGRTAAYRGEAFWTDAAILQSAGIPALLLGVNGAGAHASIEYVELSSLERLTNILTETARVFCV